MKSSSRPRTVSRRLAVALLLLGALSARADVVTDWNLAMTGYSEGLPPPGNPPLESRAYAIAHLALFHAVEKARDSSAPADIAGAQAAHDVLVKLLPGGAAGFDALLERQLAAAPAAPARDAAVILGAATAAEWLARRADDGILSGEGPYQPGTKPGDYQYTPPFEHHAPPGAAPPYAHYPKLGAARPFALSSTNQFRAPAPYRVTDSAYTADFNEIKALGALRSKVRTQEQTDIAHFWFEMGYLGWNRLARTLVAERNDSLLERARLFAVLNVAMIDALIAGFETKYTYNFWRPITAIRLAETDGNPDTAADPAWEPLMITPPMPDYVSTHSAVGSAAAVVLAWFFHGDEQTFTLTSTMSRPFPEVKPRSFHRISDAAMESAMSRLYVGIHFRAACLAGLKQGRQVGEWIIQHAPEAAGRR